MADNLDPKQLVTCEEVAISNMCEITAVVDLLERICLLPFALTASPARLLTFTF